LLQKYNKNIFKNLLTGQDFWFTMNPTNPKTNIQNPCWRLKMATESFVATPEVIENKGDVEKVVLDYGLTWYEEEEYEEYLQFYSAEAVRN